jgi:hypothetical protein
VKQLLMRKGIDQGIPAISGIVYFPHPDVHLEVENNTKTPVIHGPEALGNYLNSLREPTEGNNKYETIIKALYDLNN